MSTPAQQLLPNINGAEHNALKHIKNPVDPNQAANILAKLTRNNEDFFAPAQQ